MTEHDVYEEPHCPACGEPMSYCTGHGVVGDPRGWEVLKMHDDGNHAVCRFSAGCPLLEKRASSIYYVAQLSPALAVAQEGRSFYYEVNHLHVGTMHQVKFCTPSMTMVLDDRGTTVTSLIEDEAGRSMVSAESAYRYALGALFGPLDEGYNEAQLRQNLMYHE